MSYSQTDITKVEEDAPSELLSFFLPGAVDAALRDSGFSVGEEIELIVGMIRTAPNIHTRLAALKYGNARFKEILEVSGHIQKMTAQITGGPNQALLTAQTTRLLEVGHTNSNIGVPDGNQTDHDKGSDHSESGIHTDRKPDNGEEIIEVESQLQQDAGDADSGAGEANCDAGRGGPVLAEAGCGPGEPAGGSSDDPSDSSDEPLTVEGDAGTFTRTGHFPPETSKRGLSGR